MEFNRNWSPEALRKLPSLVPVHFGPKTAFWAGRRRVENGIADRPVAVLFWGAPCAGKTTLSHAVKGAIDTVLGASSVRLSVDQLLAGVPSESRESFRGLAYEKVEQLLCDNLAHRNWVVVDGNYLQAGRRERLLNCAERLGCRMVSLHIFCSLPTRSERNDARKISSRVASKWLLESHNIAERNSEMRIVTENSSIDKSVGQILEAILTRPKP
jgi:predicted kinase